jgi:hypothetical protein
MGVKLVLLQTEKTGRVSVFENSVLRRTGLFAPKRQELYNLYSSPNIIRMGGACSTNESVERCIMFWSETLKL